MTNEPDKAWASQPRWWTVRDVAEYRGVNIQTVYRWLKEAKALQARGEAGGIPFSQPQGWRHVRFNAAAVRAYFGDTANEEIAPTVQQLAQMAVYANGAKPHESDERAFDDLLREFMRAGVSLADHPGARGRRIVIQRSLKLRKGGEWYTTPPKTEKSIRSIALTEAFVKSLEDHRRRQLEMRLKAGADWMDNGFIFADEAGEPLKIYNVRRVHAQICAAAELPATFKLKVSRHSCASALLNDGVPLKMISERLGHSSIAVTGDIYSVVEDHQQREVSERFERLFGSGKK